MRAVIGGSFRRLSFLPRCPLWLGHPLTGHWGVPDPKRATGNEAEIALVFANTYKMLARRIGIFLALPHESLDERALKSEIDEIGEALRPSL